MNVEQAQWRASYQLPAAGQFARIDARLRAADGDGTGQHALTRLRATRHVQRGIESEQIRKAGREAEHGDAVLGAAVARDDFVDGQLCVGGNGSEICAVVAGRHFDELPRFFFDARRRREYGA